MNCENLLSWKVVLELPEKYQSKIESNNLFHIKTGTSFLKGIGGFSDRTFSPDVLDPTNIFHNALNKVKLENDFNGRRFPYARSDGQQLNINIRRFGCRVVIVTVRLKNSLTSDDKEIFEIQKLSNHSGVYNIVKSVCGLILSADPKYFDSVHSPKIYPCTQTIILDGNDWISDNRAVEIITRHKEPNENIVSKVISKNSHHQLDSSSILIDRQGVFYRVPRRLSDSNSVENKFLGTCNIIEYAIALSVILEKKYFDDLSFDERYFTQVLITDPKLVILRSVTSLEKWKLLVKEFKLDSLLSKVMNQSELRPIKKSWWECLANISTESKRFWLIGLILAGMAWAFQQSIYFDKVTGFFSMPEIEIVHPVDQETVEVSGDKILIKWEDIEGATKYVIQSEKVESGKWVIPPVDYRRVTSESTVMLRVTPQASYKIIIEAYDSHDDLIAKSKDSHFEVGIQKNSSIK